MISFNTGRPYTAEGQIIKATLHEDWIVTFWDRSRMIDGQFSLESWETFDSRTVMRKYDQGAYKSTKRSMDDAMMVGGCNT